MTTERKRETDMDMDGEKGADSSSSFTSDLFGSKDPSSASASASSSAILASIFPPNSSQVSGTESLRSEPVEKKHDCASKAGNAKPGPSVNIPQSNEGESQSQSLSKEDVSSFYNEQKVQPCHLSSSIYYGGQDICSSPQNTQSSGYSTFNKDGGENDPGSDSRGNLWQGGVYY